MRLFSDGTDMNGPAAEPEKFLVLKDAPEIGSELADVPVGPRMNDQGPRIMLSSVCFSSAAQFIA